MAKKRAALSHRDKIFWPAAGYTKGDLISYYEKVAPYLLPYLKDRPLALNRFPDGIAGKHFFQKNVGAVRLPAFVTTASIRAKKTGRRVRYALATNKETLAWLANFGAIELHPWGSRVGSLAKPDFVVFDLDPGPRSSFAATVRVALAIRKVLRTCKIPCLVKTSGKRGLHIYVPISGARSYEKARTYAHLVATEVVKTVPRVANVAHWPKDRRDKVFIDVMRNATGQTAVAPYSLRPTPDATVSTPLEWHEVKAGLRPSQFTIKTIWKRLENKGDLWKPALGRGVDLHDAIRCLQERVDGSHK